MLFATPGLHSRFRIRPPARQALLPAQGGRGSLETGGAWGLRPQLPGLKQWKRWLRMGRGVSLFRGNSKGGQQILGLGVRGAFEEQAKRDERHAHWWLSCSAPAFAFLPLLTLGVLVGFRSHVPVILGTWLFVEALFAVYRYYDHNSASTGLIELPLPSLEASEELLQRVLQLGSDVLEPNAFLSGWFLGAPATSIKRENMKEMIAYHFYHRWYTELPADYQAAVDDHITYGEATLGLTFTEGDNAAVKFMAHNREPLRTFHHPLALYTWGYSIATFAIPLLLSLGFHRYTSPEKMVYWYRPAKESASGKRKDIRFFVHGLGFGVLPYVSFVAMLAEDPLMDVVVVELPHLSLQFVREMPTMDDLVSALQSIHAAHNFGPAQYIGHSYGSLIVARLLHRSPHLVSSLGLVDPVCFLLCLPDVIYNFVYKLPGGHPTLKQNMFDVGIWLLCAKELQVARALCRGFDWHYLQLWPSQLPPCSVVVLSGRDTVIPSHKVQRHVESNGVQVLFFDDLQHAQFLGKSKVHRALVDALDTFSAEQY